MNERAMIQSVDSNRNLRVGEFTDTEWTSLVGKIASAFSFDSEQESRMAGNAVLKLVAALPYLAGSDEPERTALAHMGTFILAGQPGTRSAFDHTFRDSADIERRLETISHFSGGDERIIRWGMKLLALAMVNDHLLDSAEDASRGKMNPVNAGHWNAQELMEELKAEMGGMDNETLDVFMSDVGTQGYWQL